MSSVKKDLGEDLSQHVRELCNKIIEVDDDALAVRMAKDMRAAVEKYHALSEKQLAWLCTAAWKRKTKVSPELIELIARPKYDTASMKQFFKALPEIEKQLLDTSD